MIRRAWPYDSTYAYESRGKVRRNPMNIRDAGELRASLAKWRREEARCRANMLSRPKGSPARAYWRGKLTNAKRLVARRERQLAKLGPAKPKIRRLAAPMTQNFGALGPTRPGVGHYTAGPRDTSDAHAIALFTQYNAQHRSYGWGALGYHLVICSSGTLLLGRPTGWKGAHTAGENTGRVGVVVAGGPGQRMAAAQRETLAWLKAHGHTAAMPASHRLPVGALNAMAVHNDLNATACPGTYETDYKAAA
jgi:N-acetylmuramoyl-L-alanine amidase